MANYGKKINKSNQNQFNLKINEQDQTDQIHSN